MKYKLDETIHSLESWIKKEGYKGYDPYDGLRGRVFQLQGKYARIAFIQLHKRCPVNLRPLFLIDKSLNPKALGLFTSAYAKLHKVTGEEAYLSKAEHLANILLQAALKNFNGLCWGYNFNWQSRAFYAPEGTPNVICTIFAGNALLDLYSLKKDKKYWDAARNVSSFLLNDLNISKEDNSICFSYTPGDTSRIHNVNLLAAEYLARINAIEKDSNIEEIVKKAVRLSCERQSQDGSWFYGEDANQRWIDNFHTGYNLVALERIQKQIDAFEFTENIKRGYDYYKKNLFIGVIPKYFHDRLYPIDIHCIAQAIITFLAFEDKEKAKAVFEWAVENMRSSKGYFYFQKNKFYTNKIPYMRWSQAWMFYALIYLKERLNEN